MAVRQYSNYVDVTVQPLYDTATILAAGVSQLQFFQTQLGQPTGAFGAAGAGKTLADTNMDLPGQLPAGQNFAVLGFRLQPAYSMIAADAVKWCTGAWFVFTVGQKPYLRVPADTLPAGVGPFGFFAQAAAAAQSIASHGYPSLSSSFNIGRKPLELSSSQNFNAALNWTSAVAVATTIGTQPAAGMPVRCYLDGFFYRTIQ